MSQKEEILNTECTCLASDNGYFCEGCKNSLYKEGFQQGFKEGIFMARDRERALCEGILHCLDKPVRIDMILKQIEMLIDLEQKYLRENL